MKITEIDAKGLEQSYRVIVPAAEIEIATEAELKQLGARVKIPGFRPGNVPMKVLKQRYAKDVGGEVIKNVVNDATRKLVKDKKLTLAVTPDVEVESYPEESGDLTFKISLQVLPEIPALDYGSIALDKETYELPESEIDEALQKFARQFPSYTSLPAGTKAEKGNAVRFDFLGKIDGVAFEGGSAENFKLELGSGQFIEGFEDQMIGLKAGDEKVVKVTFPKDYFNPEVAGKPATFDVKVHEVFKLEIPEVNDEFAKARGMADLRAIREAIRNQLARGYDGLIRNRLKKQLFDVLEEKCTFDIPPKMEQMEFDAIWGRLQQNKAPGVDVYEGRSEDEVKEDYKRIARRRVKLGMLLADVGTREKLRVSSEELTQALTDHARQFPGQERAVFEFYRKNPARLDELRGPILEEKAVDFIVSKAKQTEKKITTAELSKPVDEDDTKPAKKTAKKKK